MFLCAAGHDVEANCGGGAGAGEQSAGARVKTVPRQEAGCLLGCRERSLIAWEGEISKKGGRSRLAELNFVRTTLLGRGDRCLVRIRSMDRSVVSANPEEVGGPTSRAGEGDSGAAGWGDAELDPGRAAPVFQLETLFVRGLIGPAQLNLAGGERGCDEVPWRG